MTKDGARIVLERWITRKVTFNTVPQMKLPIVDEVIYSERSFDDNNLIVQDWTFVGLIKILYDLK